jgi:hypothetical protein
VDHNGEPSIARVRPVVGHPLEDGDFDAVAVVADFTDYHSLPFSEKDPRRKVLWIGHFPISR